MQLGKEITVVMEKGLLRPETPIDLPDGTRLTIVGLYIGNTAALR